MRQGKVRFIGCSNLSAQQLIEAQDTSQRLKLAAFVSCQDEYSLLVRDIEQELLPAAKARGLGILPYFPLASGLLTGKYKRGAPMPKGSRLSKIPRHADDFMTERNWRIVGELEAFVRSARPQHARAGVQLAVERRRGRERDRGRDLAGAGASRTSTPRAGRCRPRSWRRSTG